MLPTLIGLIGLTTPNAVCRIAFILYVYYFITKDKIRKIIVFYFYFIFYFLAISCRNLVILLRMIRSEKSFYFIYLFLFFFRFVHLVTIKSKKISNDQELINQIPHPALKTKKEIT